MISTSRLSTQVQRQVYVNASSGSQPDGGADANLSMPSRFTATIDRVNKHPLIGAPAIGFNILYFFDEMDVTQGGANDRVIVDFAYFSVGNPDGKCGCVYAR
jgi:hypothetical protein